ncbi:unannotated protein [freshwater metagenome]|uniref:Unannotated protein n=1 Tax=freshwater metagenome TaxID=449393 RepID=A0A6J7DHN3_9ZZZZ
MVGSSPHDDHGAAAGVLSILGELPPNALGHGRGNTGYFLLPCRRVGRWILVSCRPVARQPVSPDAVLR